MTFDYDPSVEELAVPVQTYLRARPNAPYSLLATCALVLHQEETSEPRILLLQRAASDSKPHKWEPPGGACDDDDETILHAAARELREETGLETSSIAGLVGEPHVFLLRSGKAVCRFGFAVEVESARGIPVVKLDPKEHQNYVWATKTEIESKQVGDVHLDFTAAEVERAIMLALQALNHKPK